MTDTMDPTETAAMRIVRAVLQDWLVDDTDTELCTEAEVAAAHAAVMRGDYTTPDLVVKLAVLAARYLLKAWNIDDCDDRAEAYLGALDWLARWLDYDDRNQPQGTA
jgi:hypothetical protein